MIDFYRPKYAFEYFEIIYFIKISAFLSAFEKSDCFIYIEGKKAPQSRTLKTEYWRIHL